MNNLAKSIYAYTAFWVVSILFFIGVFYFGDRFVAAYQYLTQGPSYVRSTPDGDGVEGIPELRVKVRIYIAEFNRRTGMDYSSPIPTGREQEFNAMIKNLEWMEAPGLSVDDIMDRLSQEQKQRKK